MRVRLAKGRGTDKGVERPPSLLIYNTIQIINTNQSNLSTIFNAYKGFTIKEKSIFTIST